MHMNSSVYIVIGYTLNNSLSESNNKGETYRYSVAGGQSGYLRVERLENRDLNPVRGWRFFTPSLHSIHSASHIVSHLRVNMETYPG